MTVNRKTKLFTVAILLALVVPMVLPIVPASACEPCDGPGTGTPGYWKTHPEEWPDGITIGGVTYYADDLKQPVKGDKSITLFKALVAALLNVEAGNCSDCIDATIEDVVDNWIPDCGGFGSDVKASSECWQDSHGEALYLMLDDYNNGRLCAAPRD